MTSTSSGYKKLQTDLSSRCKAFELTNEDSDVSFDFFYIFQDKLRSLNIEVHSSCTHGLATIPSSESVHFWESVAVMNELFNFVGHSWKLITIL